MTNPLSFSKWNHWLIKNTRRHEISVMRTPGLSSWRLFALNKHHYRNKLISYSVWWNFFMCLLEFCLQHAFADDSGPDGDVWATVSDVQGYKFGTVFAPNQSRPFQMTPADAGFGTDVSFLSGRYNYPRDSQHLLLLLLFFQRVSTNIFDFKVIKDFIISLFIS